MASEIETVKIVSLGFEDHGSRSLPNSKISLYDWAGYGRRLRLVRLALNISEGEAAEAHGVTLRTYRKWEAGAPQRSGEGYLNFAIKYGVSLDWLVAGNSAWLGRHLSKNTWGKIAILPVMTRELRRTMAQ